MALHSASGAVAVTNTRPDVIPALKGVFGASRMGILTVPAAAEPMDWRANVLPNVFPRVLAASGKALAALMT